MIEEIKKLIQQSLTRLKLPEIEFALEHPAELAHGDYATNVALLLAKTTGQSPRALAEQIAAELNRLKSKLGRGASKWLEKIEIAGPGFINFHLSPEFFAGQVRKIMAAGNDYGRVAGGQGRKVILEYSSPNIAKPFSIGHFRSTVIGDALANILEFSGWEVVRDNHLGDWGTQFGKLIVAIKHWGDEAKIAQAAHPLHELVDLYVKFHQAADQDKTLEPAARDWFAKLEQGDAEAKRLWQKCVDWSLAEFNALYSRLGVRFDTAYGESFFADKTEAVVKKLSDGKLLKESEGAQLVFFAGDKYPPLMIKKSDGATLYATRDLAADHWRRQEYGPETVIINEAGSEQTIYFQQLYETERLLGWFKPGERVHVKHGLYRFKEGKMSTREGNVIWLEEVIDEAIKRAAAFNQAVAEAVGIGALKYNDLKRDSRQDIIFDWDDVLNLEGNSGPYLQYTYARTQSVLAKAEDAGIVTNIETADEKADKLVERWLARFPEAVARAAAEYAPHHLANYLYELAGAFNAYYQKHQIVSDQAAAPYRVALTQAVGQVLANGLHLLGLQTPEKI